MDNTDGLYRVNVDHKWIVEWRIRTVNNIEEIKLRTSKRNLESLSWIIVVL